MDTARLSCARCRAVKRKCSRDLPKCRRCCAMGVDCCYPQRKKRTTPTRNNDRVTTLFSQSRTLPVIWQSSGLSLLDVYFSHFLPSSILFHQDRIRRRYMDGQLPNFVLHAIFALASLFLGNTRTSNHSVHPDSSILDCRQHGQDWADDASHVAALQLQRPSLDTVRTMYNLTAYWFAVGQKEKFQICANMALQAVRDLARESDRVPQDQSRSLRWCCFWTDMACRCFVLDDSFSSPAQVIDISDIALGSSFHLAPTLVEIQPTRAQGALLNTLSLWREARLFIRGLDPDSDATERWAALFALDSKVSGYYESLPSSLREIGGTDGREVPELVLALQALYHLCRALPHLAMFMFLQQTPRAAPEYKQLCAQIAIRRFNSFAEIVTQFLSLGSATASATPPYVAYCAFLTASMHLSYLTLVQPSVTSVSDKALPPQLALLKRWALSSLLLLRRLQCYWSSCQEMCRRLQPLCQTLQISLSDLQTHGRVVQEEASNLLFSSFGAPFHDHAAPSPKSARDELESAMSRNIARIVQVLDLSHPAYCDFQKLQSALVPTPIIPQDSPETFPDPPYDGYSIPTQPSSSFIPIPTVEVPRTESVPRIPSSSRPRRKPRSRRPRSRPRTWIAARPPETYTSIPTPAPAPAPTAGAESPYLLDIDPTKFWNELEMLI